LIIKSNDSTQWERQSSELKSNHSVQSENRFYLFDLNYYWIKLGQFNA